MKIPFANLFKGQSKKIPAEVINQLDFCFPNAKNIDWEMKNEAYEAVFYLNDVEHIAKISKKGELIEYKKNLWLDELPEKVNDAGNSFGEIMNAIIIIRNEEVFYELIVRNQKLDRFENIYNLNGDLIKSVQL